MLDQIILCSNKLIRVLAHDTGKQIAVLEIEKQNKAYHQQIYCEQKQNWLKSAPLNHGLIKFINHLIAHLWAIATDAGLSFETTDTYETLEILRIGEISDVWFHPAGYNSAVAVTKAGSVICINHPIDDEPPENIYDSIKFTVLHGDVPDEIKEWKLFQFKQ